MKWETLWAVGRYDLRLTDEEFWNMVPRQFFALLERKRVETIAREHGPAMVVTALLTLLGGRKQKKVNITDYMPSWRSQQKEEMPWEQQLEYVKGLHKMFGGQ